MRLGMTSEQVRARFKVLETEPADEFGVARLRLQPAADYLAAEAVNDIAVELIGERVVSIRLVYRPFALWKHQREFSDWLSGTLKLPRAWKPLMVGSIVTGMEMECAGFKLSAALIGVKIPVVYLSFLDAAPTLSRRQAERERRLREFFKP